MDVRSEIYEIKQRLWSVEKSLSQLQDKKHTESLGLISQDEDAICELSEETAESIAAIEDAICELSENI